ncbi:MAG TPA: gas vesicle accessory protein GvpU [Acidimicrobiales bacterium]|jgi:hypothetical protein
MKTPSHNDDHDDEAALPDPQGLDKFLRILTGAADRSDSEIALTLNVGGVLISGKVCSPAAYFEGLAQGLEAAADGNMAMGGFATMFKEWAEDFRQPLDGEPDWDSRKVTMIHMKDAQFFTPGQAPLPNNQGVYWRGRLSSVDGFSWGRLRAEVAGV